MTVDTMLAASMDQRAKELMETYARKKTEEAARVNALIAELQAENERLKRQLAALPEYCPVCHNAAHQPCEAGTEGAVLDDGGEWIVCEVCHWKREALRLKQDAARLDWLYRVTLRKTVEIWALVPNSDEPVWFIQSDGETLGDGFSINEAIDAAMKESEEE